MRGPVEPGHVPWFPAEDWSPDSYLFENGQRVMLSLLIARKPRSGAFTRLERAILASGRAVCVPAPIPAMERILRRRGYSKVLEWADDYEEFVPVWIKEQER